MQLNINLKACMFAVALSGLVITSCSKDDSKTANTENAKGTGAAKGQGQEDETPVVKIEKVFVTDVTQNGSYMASVEADVINNITSNTPNRIIEITVDEGMEVSKGEKLVVLEDVNIVAYEAQVNNARSGVDAAQAGVVNAQSGLDNAKANLDNVQLNYDRALELYNIGGGTKQNVDAMQTQLITAKNSYTSAKSALASAKSQLASAQSALASAERTLLNAQENTVLVSPIDGVVTARNYEPGDIPAGLPILTVAKVQPVKFVSNISESEFSKVKKGMEIECTLNTYGDEKFTGIVTMISPTIDTSSRTFGIEVTVKNPDMRILPGMYGNVLVNYGTERHVVVPDLAVVKQPGSGNHYVYLYKDGKVSYNKVELGQRIGNTYEIISGVEDGDEVVVSGQARLANGMEVKVMK